MNSSTVFRNKRYVFEKCVFVFSLIALGFLSNFLRAEAGVYSTAILAEPSLQSYYRLDDASGASTAADSDGGQALTATGVTFNQTSLLTGGEGAAASFNGSSSSLSATSSTVFNYGTSDPWTIEFIMTPNVTRSGVYAGYTMYSKFGSDRGYEVRLVYGDGSYGSKNGKTVLHVLVANNASGGNLFQVFGNTDITNGTTYHVAISYDGSGYATGTRMYLNGTLEQATIYENNLSGTIVAAVPATIGSRQSSIYYQGVLDEVSIYNTALYPKSIFKHYRGYLNTSLGSSSDPAEPTAPVQVILDTDIASDVGDVGAVGILHVLEQQGEVDILGMVVDSANVYSAPALKALNTYYGRSSIPIGANQASTPTTDGAATSAFTQTIRDEFGTASDTRTNYSRATTTYRQLLAAAADDSVTILSIGFLNNLSDLLQTPADAISGLTGLQLVNQKVKRLVVMGGKYESGSEYNFYVDPASTCYVMSNWPTDVITTGFELGTTVFNGPPAGANPATNPIKRAYNLSGYSTREAWDQLAILYGIRGLSTTFQAVGVYGTDSVNCSSGANSWSSTAGLHTFLGKIASDQTITNALDALLATAPDTTAPNISSISGGTPTSSGTTVTWTTDEISESQVEYGLTTSYNASSTLDTTLVTSHSVSLSSLSAATTYHFRVISRDNIGNTSTSSDQTFTTAAAPDVTAPSVSMTAPTDGSTISGASVVISANASDAVGVSGVQFKRNTNTLVGAEDTTSAYSVTFDSTGVSDGSYTFIAVARDAAGNRATSSAVTVTVDNTEPSRSSGSPTTELSAGTTSTTLSLSTNETATCKYSVSSGTAYGSMTAFSSTNSTSHSTTISGLTNSTSYTYYVRCQDGQGNTNTTDYSVSFSVATPSATTTTTTNSSGSASGRKSSVATFQTSTQTYRPTTIYIPPLKMLFTRDLKLQSTGSDVKYLQEVLIQKGYLSPSNNTGYFGPLTFKAVSEYQRVLGITQTGYFGPITRNTMNTASTLAGGDPQLFIEDLYVGSENENVRRLQQFLNQNGFILIETGRGSPGSEILYFGPSTRDALIRFQKANNISPAEGYFGTKTREKVNQILLEKAQ